MVLTVESVDEILQCDGDLSRLQRRDHELARNRLDNHELTWFGSNGIYSSSQQ